MISQFLSCDWGSSRVRLRLVRLADRRVEAEIASEQGASRIAAPGDTPASRAAAFSRCLNELLGQLAGTADCSLSGLPLVASGMVTSRHGWQDVPYAPLPVALDGRGLSQRRLQLESAWGAHPVWLISGLCSDRDVMRGEECELLGLPHCPGWSGRNAVVLLPGTHSKHVTIRDNRVTGFTTHMTGELFDLFLTQSVLGRTASLPADGTAHRRAFHDGVRAAAVSGLGANLFQVRARSLLDPHVSAADGAAFLEGLLLGEELGPLLNRDPLPQVWLCANPRLAASYIAAAETLGLAGHLQTLPPDTVEHLVPWGHCTLLPHLTGGDE